MIFKEKKTIHKILKSLFETYSERVPDVKKITDALIKKNIIKSQHDIINDHIAFRTMGVKNLGIKSFEKIFLHHGYTKRDFYSFEKKKLNAFWYSHSQKNMPRIFISELRVNELSKKTQQIIYKYTDKVCSDPVDRLNLDNSSSNLSTLILIVELSSSTSAGLLIFVQDISVTWTSPSIPPRSMKAP